MDEYVKCGTCVYYRCIYIHTYIYIRVCVCVYEWNVIQAQKERNPDISNNTEGPLWHYTKWHKLEKDEHLTISLYVDSRTADLIETVEWWLPGAGGGGNGDKGTDYQYKMSRSWDQGVVTTVSCS